VTYNEILKELKERFEAAGLPEPSSDAMLLMDYIAGMNRTKLFLSGNEEVPADILESLREAAGKRILRIPLQHITGFQSFMGLEIAVDENVLIPRQDTEILVEEIIKEGSSGLRILDLCTGSGCILLSLLKYMNNCEGVGVDISEEALELARKNSERLHIPATFIHSDLFDSLSKNDDKYDIIVSNPPYIKSDDIDGLMDEVRLHEPLIALDGDTDGLKFYRIITDRSGEYLSIGGKLYFEIGYDEASEVSRLMTDAGFIDVRVIKDLAGLDRVVRGEYAGNLKVLK